MARHKHGGYTPNRPLTNAFGGAFGAGAGYAANNPLTNGSPISNARGKVGTLNPTLDPVTGKPKPTAPVQPIDPNVLNQQVTARRNIQIGDLNALFQQGQLDQSYGFGAGGAANPYSQAALLQENYKRSQLGTTNSYASQGQLYSGAIGRQKNENTRNYDIGYDQLRRAYDTASGNLKLGRLQNYANAGTGISDARFQALLAQLGKL